MAPAQPLLHIMTASNSKRLPAAPAMPIGSPPERWGSPKRPRPAPFPAPPSPDPGASAPLGRYTPEYVYTRNQFMAVYRERRAQKRLGLPHDMAPPSQHLAAVPGQPSAVDIVQVLDGLNQPSCSRSCS